MLRWVPIFISSLFSLSSICLNIFTSFFLGVLKKVVWRNKEIIQFSRPEIYEPFNDKNEYISTQFSISIRMEHESFSFFSPCFLLAIIVSSWKKYIHIHVSEKPDWNCRCSFLKANKSCWFWVEITKGMGTKWMYEFNTNVRRLKIYYSNITK